jgi:hypothetical protein
MANSYIALQPSEIALLQATAQIYSAYIVSGRAEPGSEDDYLERSIREAVRIAKTIDSAVTADKEMD